MGNVCPERCFVQIIQEEQDQEPQIDISFENGLGVTLPISQANPHALAELTRDDNAVMDEQTRTILKQVTMT